MHVFWTLHFNALKKMKIKMSEKNRSTQVLVQQILLLPRVCNDVQRISICREKRLLAKAIFLFLAFHFIGLKLRENQNAKKIEHTF